MRKAQIENGLVINVIEVDPKAVPDFCADWPDAGDAGPGWVFAEGEFSQPVPELTAAAANAAITAAIASVEDALTEGVPLGEKLSWPAKEAAARAVLVGNATEADTELLAGEATLTGETVAELAGRIVARATQYRFAISRLSGIRRSASARIASAETGKALEQAVSLAQAQCAAILEAANGL